MGFFRSLALSYQNAKKRKLVFFGGTNDAIETPPVFLPFSLSFSRWVFLQAEEKPLLTHRARPACPQAAGAHRYTPAAAAAVGIVPLPTCFPAFPLAVPGAAHRAGGDAGWQVMPGCPLLPTPANPAPGKGRGLTRGGRKLGRAASGSAKSTFFEAQSGLPRGRGFPVRQGT